MNDKRCLPAVALRSFSAEGTKTGRISTLLSLIQPLRGWLWNRAFFYCYSTPPGLLMWCGRFLLLFNPIGVSRKNILRTKLLILLSSYPLLLWAAKKRKILPFLDRGIIIVNRSLSSRHRRATRDDSVFLLLMR